MRSGHHRGTLIKSMLLPHRTKRAVEVTPCGEHALISPLFLVSVEQSSGRDILSQLPDSQPQAHPRNLLAPPPPNTPKSLTREAKKFQTFLESPRLNWRPSTCSTVISVSDNQNVPPAPGTVLASATDRRSCQRWARCPQLSPTLSDAAHRVVLLKRVANSGIISIHQLIGPSFATRSDPGVEPPRSDTRETHTLHTGK